MDGMLLLSCFAYSGAGPSHEVNDAITTNQRGIQRLVCRSVLENSTRNTSTMSVKMLSRAGAKGSTGQCIRCTLPYIRSDIPILIVFRALGFVVSLFHPQHFHLTAASIKSLLCRHCRRLQLHLALAVGPCAGAGLAAFVPVSSRQQGSRITVCFVFRQVYLPA